MFFEIKNWKNKVALEEFRKKKKEVLNLVNLDKLSNFSFLHQEKKILKKKILECSELFSNYEKIVLLGTGGSSLGCKAILEAGNNNRVVFIENIDPDYVIKKISKVKKKKILLLIISKSGETTEVLSLYQIIINYFSDLFNSKKNILIITEKKNSFLYRIAKSEDIKLIEHNPKIGGRFSCFSETALIPLKLAGLNSFYIKNLADKTFNKCIKEDNYSFSENIVALNSLINKKKYKCHVVLSYQESIKSLILWYRQLWAESLGKNRKGIHFIAATGSIDQHSQLQMWLNGPDNLFYTIILPRKRKGDFKLKDNNKIIPSYLNKKTLGNILNTMGLATYKELVKAGRPVRLIYLDDDSLYPSIKLMSYLMLEVAVLGKFIGINPFDQPAVESVKILTKNLLIKNEKY